MGQYPASTVAPFALLAPVFGLAFAALLLGESLSVREIVAAVLVLGGVLLTLRPPRRVDFAAGCGITSPDALQTAGR